MVKPSSFLLIKANGNSSAALATLSKTNSVAWQSAIYGPYQILAYIEDESEEKMVQVIESLRSEESIREIDARRVKVIPKDEGLRDTPKSDSTKIRAALLINVNYKEEKERVVTWNLRDVKGVKYARAMWGPTDIIAIVEADDHESMRDLICDDIKTLKGVKENSTLYCYPIVL